MSDEKPLSEAPFDGFSPLWLDPPAAEALRALVREKDKKIEWLISEIKLLSDRLDTQYGENERLRAREQLACEMISESVKPKLKARDLEEENAELRRQLGLAELRRLADVKAAIEETEARWQSRTST